MSGDAGNPADGADSARTGVRHLDPAELTFAERYKLLVGAIVPRPIAFVSTCDAEGRLNLAPYSFFNGVGSDPMTLLFCPANHMDGREKDTLRNCKPEDEGGLSEFVVNVATERYAAQVAAAAEELEPGDSEFDLIGMAAEPSRVVRPPRLKASPVSFECRTLEVVRLGEGRPGGPNVVIGEVVHVAAHESVIDDRGRIDPAALAAVGRMAGSTYVTTRDRFDLPRGKAALGMDVDGRG